MSDTLTTTDPKTGQAIQYQTGPICGFWRRILAMFLDWLILGCLGAILGFFFCSQFVAIGGYGKLIGLAIALCYFGILNSRFGKGQSIGKRVFKIKVVDKNGANITPLKSFFRSFILELPFFLNGWSIPTNLFTPAIVIILGLIVFGLGGATFYLYLFNRNTRQSLHDLLSGTYVVQENVEGSIMIAPIYKLHYTVIIIIFIVLMGLPFIIKPFIPKDVFYRITALQKQISASHKITNVLVSEGVQYSSGNKRTSISVVVFVKNRSDVLEDFAKDIAKKVLTVEEYRQKDYIKIKPLYGYDIGIWGYHYAHNFDYPPQEWLEKINTQ